MKDNVDSANACSQLVLDRTDLDGSQMTIWQDASSFVYHRIILSTQFVVAMLGSVTQLRRSPLRMVATDGLCSRHLLMMWSAICSGLPHSHAALSASPHFFMGDLYRPTPVRSRFSTRIFSLDAFSWGRSVMTYKGGSGCFPLVLPRCHNPCIHRPVLRDDT